MYSWLHRPSSWLLLLILLFSGVPSSPVVESAPLAQSFDAEENGAGHGFGHNGVPRRLNADDDDDDNNDDDDEFNGIFEEYDDGDAAAEKPASRWTTSSSGASAFASGASGSRIRRAGPNSVLSQETYLEAEEWDESLVGRWAKAAFEFVQNLRCGPEATLFR